tara:strand:+ start:16590 stop:17135 length:546 start_codon:yes stop_codon:yes gene_type:complete
MAKLLIGERGEQIAAHFNETTAHTEFNVLIRTVIIDRHKRKNMLSEIGKQYTHIVVLTEGVLPYLTQEQVAELAEDLLSEPNIKNWIADYISPVVYKYLKESKRAAKIKNAPFQFYPPDWFGFFSAKGWDVDTIQYLPEEGQKLGRSMPAPFIAKLIGPFLSKATKEKFMRTSGYMIMKRK